VIDNETNFNWIKENVNKKVFPNLFLMEQVADDIHYISTIRIENDNYILTKKKNFF